VDGVARETERSITGLLEVLEIPGMDFSGDFVLRHDLFDLFDSAVSRPCVENNVTIDVRGNAVETTLDPLRFVAGRSYSDTASA
jgi:hypothetical protein